MQGTPPGNMHARTATQELADGGSSQPLFGQKCPSLAAERLRDC